MLKTKLGKRLLTFGLAAVVALGMAIPAFAATSATDDKLTKPASDPYTYRIASDRITTTATLRVGPAHDDFTFMGWATPEAASAATVEWTVTQGTDLVTLGVPSIVPVTEGTVVSYAYQVVVSSTKDRAKFGAASVRAEWINAPNPSPYGASMDFSINVDSYNQQKAKTGVIVDVQIDKTAAAKGFETYADNIKVVASGSYTLNNPLHSTTAAQTYSTPLGALVELIKPTGVTAADYDSHIQGMTVKSDGTYLDGVNGYYFDGTVKTSDRHADGWEGWVYRVYRGTGSVKNMVPESAYVGSSGLSLQDSDVVMWRYGNFTFPATYTVQ